MKTLETAGSPQTGHQNTVLNKQVKFTYQLNMFQPEEMIACSGCQLLFRRDKPQKNRPLCYLCESVLNYG